MLAPKCATYNGRSNFANLKYLKIAQSETPRLYEIPYDTSDHANRFCPNREETTLKKMHDDLEYVKSLEKEIDELESEKADFSNIYDLLLEECSNDMVHNYYLEKAKKSAQLQKDKEVNGKPSMIDPARLPNTANGCKPKPRNWQASMSIRVQTKIANHDECVLEYLSRLNPRASAQNKDAKSHKTTKRYMPVEKSSASKKPERQIPTGHRKVYSTLDTGKVDSEPAHGSIVDIPHIHACKQTLGLSAGTSFNGQKQQRIDITADALYNEKQENLRVCSSSLGRQCQMASAENNTSGPVPQCSNDVCSHQFRPRSSSNDF
ncbi:hypothetical protein Tco_1424639 [Tanacetum coccineum]